MSHFAKIENGLVTKVIVAEKDFVNTQEGQWVQTSYNTKANQHPEGRPLRGNYAGIGYIYDAVNDVFYAPQPFPSWTLEKNWTWKPPVEMSTDGKLYKWDEPTLNWVEITI
jgi:hypothetical protein